MIITGVDVTHIRVPFAAPLGDWAVLDVAHLRDLQIVRIRTDDPEYTGVGEQPYAGELDHSVLTAIKRRTPIEVCGWDWLGRGVQMALYDLLGHQLGVPVWQILGAQHHRDRVPISWWSSSLTPATEWPAEARRAHDAGYRTHKIKAYPWMDLTTVAAQVVGEAGRGYSLDLDFNGMLRTRGEALSVLTDLASAPGVGILESPCRGDAVADLAAVRTALPRPVAEHWRSATSRAILDADAVDGFVFFEGGATELMRQLTVADHANKAGWVQLLGNQVTTAYAVHLSAASPAARWPVVTCSNLLEHPLVRDPLPVREGSIAVPMRPGLGVELDEDAVARYTVDVDDPPTPSPRHVLVISDASGRVRRHQTFRSAWIEARNIGWGEVRVDDPHLEIRMDDGSADFDAEWRSAECWLPTIGGFAGHRRAVTGPRPPD